MDLLAQPTINSMSKTESRCAKTGSLTANVTGGTGTLQYSLITPSKETRPNQVSNTFLALAPGNYTIRVEDVNGRADTNIFTITGNYTIPTFTTTVRAAYCSKSNGYFRINLKNSGGRNPLRYKISSGPTTTGWQSSNVFSSVPKGTYSVSVSDSCGNTKNISVTIADSVFNALQIRRYTLKRIPGHCDSISIYFRAFYGIGPLKYRVIVGTDTIKFSSDKTIRLKKGATFLYQVVDDCNVVRQVTLYPNKSISLPFVFECTGFKITVNPVMYGLYLPSACYKYGVINKATNVARWQTSSSFVVDSNVNYDIYAIDTCCKDTFKINRTFIRNSTFSVNKQYITNLDSTTGAYFANYSTRTPFHAILLQSPFSVNDSFTTTPDQDVQGKLSYNYKSGDTLGYYFNVGFYMINLPKGIYKVMVKDTCGLQDTVTFEVLEGDLWKRDIKASYIPGCPSGHAITYEIKNTSRYRSNFYFRQISPSTSSTNLISKIPNGVFRDTIPSQNAGTYVFEIFNTWGGVIMTGKGGRSYIRDTVVVKNPGYPLMEFPTTYSCKNGSSSIIAKANGGVKPYRFRIRKTTSSTWGALQVSSEFHNLTSGAYSIEVIDSCGNTNVISTSSGFLTAPSLKLGFTCDKDTLTIFGNPIYGVNYKWFKGTTVVSTDLEHKFIPYKVSDYGTYKLQAYLTTTNGVCVDTSASITIGSSIEVRSRDEVACDSFLFKSNWYKETGFVKDTLQSVGGCDSVAVVKVYVSNKNYITLDSTMCDSSNLFNKWYYSSQMVSQNFPGLGYVLDTLSYSDFETPPTGWTFNTTSITTGNASSGTKKIEFNNLTDWVTLPKVDFPDEIVFDYKLNSLINGANKLKVQYLKGGTWVDVEEIEQNSSIYEKQKVDLSLLSDSTQVQLRMQQSVQSGGTHTYLDNIFVTNTIVECDTLVSINLKINKSNIANPNRTECDSALVFGKWYYASQNVLDTLTTYLGCDSFVTTNLVINNTKVTRQDLVVCDSTILHGDKYFTSQMVLDTLRSFAGCDSLVYTNLIVNYTKRTYSNVVACDSAMIHSKMYYSNQLVRDTFTTIKNCDSIVLTDLVVNYTARTYEDLTVCDSVQVHGKWYFSSQIVNDTFSFKYRCDSIVITDLKVNYTLITPLNLTVCDSGIIHGKMYYSSGLVKDSFQSILGCDSVVWTNLVVNYTKRTYESMTACDSASIHGKSYFTSKLVRDTFVSYLKCDSIVITDLTVNYTARTYEVLKVCDSVEIHSNWYFDTKIVNDTFATYKNCDSIVITDLKVHYTKVNPVNLTVCDSSSVHGKMYYSSALIKDSFQSFYACDSVVWTNLVVNYTKRTYVSRTVCDSVSIHGNSYYSSRVVSDTFISYLNCDSIVLTNLTVNYTARTYVDSTNCDSAQIHGNWYFTSQIVNDTFLTYLNCDSIVITNLIVNATIVTKTNGTACDSMMVNGNWYFSSQLVTDYLTSYLNCDSIVYTDLIIRNSFKRAYSDTFCKHYTYELNDGRVVEEPGVYQSVYTNVSNCDSIIEVDLIEKNCEPCTIYFPSAFTPNIDGRNESFKREGSCTFKKYELSIFNRWGELMFYTEDPNLGWDGVYLGSIVQGGVYFFSCYYINVEEKVENISGDLTVLK